MVNKKLAIFMFVAVSVAVFYWVDYATSIESSRWVFICGFATGKLGAVIAYIFSYHPRPVIK